MCKVRQLCRRLAQGPADLDALRLYIHEQTGKPVTRRNAGHLVRNARKFLHATIDYDVATKIYRMISGPIGDFIHYDGTFMIDAPGSNGDVFATLADAEVRLDVLKKEYPRDFATIERLRGIRPFG